MRNKKTVPATSVKAPTPAVIPFPSTQQEFFTMKEAGEYLRCSYWAIREACYTGELLYAPLGKTYSLHISDMRAWFEKQKKSAAEKRAA